MIPSDHTSSDIPEYDYSYVGTIERYTPPFVRGRCGDGLVGGPSCQAIRRTAGLIRDAGPEPEVRVLPPNPPPTTGPVYHKCIRDSIPAFDAPATSADSRREHASIYGEAEADAVGIYELNRESRSVMPGNSAPVWLSPGHDGAKQNGVTDMIFHIKPETVTYGDRYQPGFIPLPQARVVP